MSLVYSPKFHSRWLQTGWRQTSTYCTWPNTYTHRGYRLPDWTLSEVYIFPVQIEVLWANWWYSHGLPIIPHHCQRTYGTLWTESTWLSPPNPNFGSDMWTTPSPSGHTNHTDLASSFIIWTVYVTRNNLPWKKRVKAGLQMQRSHNR